MGILAPGVLSLVALTAPHLPCEGSPSFTTSTPQEAGFPWDSATPEQCGRRKMNVQLWGYKSCNLFIWPY